MREPSSHIDAWCGTEEAAGKLGCTVRRVRQLIDEGKLIGRRMGRVWLVSKESVLDRLERLDRPGDRKRQR